MKFIITRTSEWDNEKSPCEEAKRDNIVWVQTFNYHTPEEFNKNLGRNGRKWYNEGTNHRTNENGNIERDYGTIDVWTIEINTLDDLIAFCNKYGDVVIEDYHSNRYYKTIEIYDDYRE